MSLYNMMFGVNQAAPVLLATLGLKLSDVGRFRDAWVEKTDDGQVRIAVYTRNGGGNRECWHTDGSGNEGCKHHVERREVDEFAFMPQDEFPDGKAPGNFFRTVNGKFGCSYRTGRKVMEDFHICDAPGSAECACPGCTINYRLPAHPFYLSDQDDDFDCTYATIYFGLPDAYAADLTSLALDTPHDPSAAWVALLDGLRTSTPEPRP